MSEECGVDKSLCGGITIKGPMEIIGGKYDPSVSVAGWKPGEGDTHGDIILEPDCDCDIIT